jgi:hypothetical protein
VCVDTASNLLNTTSQILLFHSPLILRKNGRKQRNECETDGERDVRRRAADRGARLLIDRRRRRDAGSGRRCERQRVLRISDRLRRRGGRFAFRRQRCTRTLVVGNPFSILRFEQ